MMTPSPLRLETGDAPEIEAFLADRIYEFNAKATGCFDGERFSGTRRDDTGAIRAGICGHTWAGCCYVSYLWVDESDRGRGTGTALLAAAEQHAKTRGCSIVLVATHSFQAPAFYRRRGYERRATVRDHPMGHASFVYAKRLRDPGA
jgi:GNAT superfamily N-acetyltransferase